MSWTDKDLGPVDAYALAVEGGYTGTKEQWVNEIGNASTNAQTASTKAAEAEAWATGGTEGTPSETNNAKYYSEQSASSATTASDKADLAQAWATGGSGGTPSATNNCKYYRDSAAAIAAGDVIDDTAGTGDVDLTWSADKLNGLKSELNSVEDFCEALGYPEKLAITSDFANGLWTGNGRRTDGNYGKYVSLDTGKLIQTQDITIKVSSSNLSNYVCSIAIFDSQKAYLGAPVGIANMDISSGTLQISADTIFGYYAGGVYISVEIGKVSGSTYYDLNADTRIKVLAESTIDIPEEITNIKNEISDIKNELGQEILSTSDFFYGMWTSSGLRTNGAYGLLKTHQNMLNGGNYKIVVTDSTAGVNNYTVSITTYDANGDFIEIKPSNAYMTNGVYYYKGTATAKKIRINIGILSGSTYTQVPATATISIIAVKDFSKESTITVDKNGNGDFDLIADAIRFANDSVSMPVTIFIKPGIYDEVCNVKSRYLSFIGENRDSVIWINHTGMYANAPLFIDGNFTVENITFEMLDDEAPESWTPGTSQSDPATMLPGYAFHIDGGRAYTPQNSIYTYRLGVCRNCRFYSEVFPAVGTGLHSHQKLVFENCEFIRKTKAKYNTNYTNYRGAFLNHATTHSDDYADEHLELINCRCICNLGASATFDYQYTYSDDTELNFIGNTFWCEETEAATVVFNQSTATLLGTSRLNNATALNAE